MNNFSQNSKSHLKTKDYGLRTGFTLLEILIAVSILTVVSFVIWRTMNTYREKQHLNAAVEIVVSALSEAREHTLTSQEDSQYGVHFGTTTIVVFRGNSYTVGAATNITYTLPSATYISTTTFAGGSTHVLFDRLLGTTSNYGTTTIALKNSTTTVRHIITSSGGLIEQR